MAHKPKPNGDCTLACTCNTPLTNEELEILDELGLY
jgi:hypothetical protein